jgi:large subunit ribosomal protein L18
MRSNKHLFAQLIDDENHITLFGVGTMGKKAPFGKKSKEAARKIGEKVGTFAKEKNIKNVVFDRGPYKYHGLVAEIANGAREAGLQF